MRVQHRAFTYQEKKFNNFGRSGLIDTFKQKYNPETIQRHFLVKHDKEITMKDAKKVALELEEREWKENEDSITALVDMILICANRFDTTNIESFAMTCHVYKAVGDKGELTEREVGDITEKALTEANELRLNNWDRFMRILKEVT